MRDVESPVGAADTKETSARTEKRKGRMTAEACRNERKKRRIRICHRERQIAPGWKGKDIYTNASTESTSEANISMATTEGENIGKDRERTVLPKMRSPRCWDTGLVPAGNIDVIKSLKYS